VARLGDDDAWVAPHLGATSLNINAAVFGAAVGVGWPSVQLAGVPGLGAEWGGYCGNDYAATAELEAALVADVQAQTARLGEWLQARGFQGLFGLDFVVESASGRAVAVDLNPRWQGSTALSVQAELDAGRLPLAAALFAAQAGLLGPAEWASLATGFGAPLRAAQLNPRAPADAPFRVASGARPGAWSEVTPDDGARTGSAAVAWRGPARRLDELRDDAGWLLTCGLPRPGVSVEPGAWMGRVQSRRAAVSADGAELHPWARSALQHLHASLGVPAQS
jgi:hypothetical protein